MSSKRNLRRKACAGKQAYSDVSQAQAVASYLRRKKNRPGMGAYRCSFCGQFHIGHPPANVRAAIAARKRNKL